MANTSCRVVLAVAVIAGLALLVGCAADPQQPPALATPGSGPASAGPMLAGELARAAAANDSEQVRHLIARGATIETRDQNGRTPLVIAAKARATAAARELIKAGANVNAKDNLQDSAYLYAGAEGLDDILELTLAHGADVRSLNRYGGTALIPASEHGHVTTVRRLIAAGVNVNHVNTPRWTALQEAIVYGDGSPRYQQVVTALLGAGADPLIRDGNGNTALDNARRRGQDAIVAILRGQQRPGHR